MNLNLKFDALKLFSDVDKIIKLINLKKAGAKMFEIHLQKKEKN